MSKHLTVIAKITAKEGHASTVKEELLKLIEPTHKEDGCILYDLHTDNENHNLFVFYEIWQSEALWQKHNENTPLAEFLKATDGLLQDLSVNQLTKI